jgi:cyclomaltodextrinase / maltogenic alpha-amylase / neopullulanase
MRARRCAAANYRTLHIASEQLAFARTRGDETVIVAANASHGRATIPLPATTWRGRRLVDRLDPSTPLAIASDRVALDVPPCWGRVLVVE